ncbi:hypothetical protein WR25_05805 [Diploscapter pachys]|uniref:BHLH domain-containing protein n=1 Tax=Diploscapter pachys TaxID=2018661 RepID=A0A2A2JQ24_9BILA|nr:hypothetical protein WR25_05805 [Diploscapter pachys]
MNNNFYGLENSKLEKKNEPKREKRKYRCRKRSPATIERARTMRRDKANARERRRMNNLNDALELLRSMLPALPDEPKMTKIETLRKAQDYIQTLYQLTSLASDSSFLQQQQRQQEFLSDHLQHRQQFVHFPSSNSSSASPDVSTPNSCTNSPTYPSIHTVAYSNNQSYANFTEFQSF